jgi:hypothetical protein
VDEQYLGHLTIRIDGENQTETAVRWEVDKRPDDPQVARQDVRRPPRAAASQPVGH